MEQVQRQRLNVQSLSGLEKNGGFNYVHILRTLTHSHIDLQSNAYIHVARHVLPEISLGRSFFISSAVRPFILASEAETGWKCEEVTFDAVARE